MSVKRYQMQESAFGPFVPYKDYFKINNENTTLRARAVRLEQMEEIIDWWGQTHHLDLFNLAEPFRGEETGTPERTKFCCMLTTGRKELYELKLCSEKELYNFTRRGLDDEMSDYPNARDCQHGQLRRSCPICAAEDDYSALLARHNALVEAVKKLRKLEEGVPSDIDEVLYGNYVKNKIAARAEVDRLLAEGE